MLFTHSKLFKELSIHTSHPPLKSCTYHPTAADQHHLGRSPQRPPGSRVQREGGSHSTCLMSSSFPDSSPTSPVTSRLVHLVTNSASPCEPPALGPTSSNPWLRKRPHTCAQVIKTGPPSHAPHPVHQQRPSAPSKYIPNPTTLLPKLQPPWPPCCF